MKRIIIATIIAAGIAFPAAAQQPQQPPEVAMFRQLLQEANDRVVALGARATMAEAKVTELTAQIEKRKQEDEAATAAKK